MLKKAGAAILAAASLSAYALTPGNGSWVKETATYGTPNLQNAYVYVPKNASPEIKNSKRALMLTLHACTMSAPGNVINGNFNWEATAEKYGMVVVAPTAPARSNNCWDWTGSDFSRTTRDAAPLLKLIDSVRSRAELDIDPWQIYVTGISSGGVQTAVMSCAFPEIFTGVGIVAAPVLGSTSATLNVTAEQMATICRAANGNGFNSAFSRQITNVLHGTADPNVDQSHSQRTLEGRAVVYGMDLNTASNSSLPGGATLTSYKDSAGNERLSKIIVSGLKHEWPAGGTGTASMINNTTVNYPAWITDWLFANNPRLKTPPCQFGYDVVTPGNLHASSITDNCVSLGWAASANTCIAWNVYRNGVKVALSTSPGYTVCGLTPDTSYTFGVTSFNNSNESAMSSITVRTTGAKPFVCTSTTGLNSAHISAGRATCQYGLAYAKGSKQLLMGTCYIGSNTLSQTAPDYYISGLCPK